MPGRTGTARVIIGGLAIAIVLVGGYFAVVLLVYPTVLPQQSVHLLPDAMTPGVGQKVLVFVPHPDDETIAVGGYIAQSRQQGADVRLVLVTDGNKHHNEAVRHAELRAATAVLGVRDTELVFLNLPDGSLSHQAEATFLPMLGAQVDAYGPDVILYPWQLDFHPDHAALGKAMNKVVAGGSNGRTIYQYLVHYEFYYPHPKKFAPDLFLLPPARLVRFGNGWQKLMLSQSVEGLKKNAIYSYKSQLGNPLLKELLLSSIRKNELLIAR
jgi:LmbE family N-acetylglucosaminyl deacetylase